MVHIPNTKKAKLLHYYDNQIILPKKSQIARHPEN